MKNKNLSTLKLSIIIPLFNEEKTILSLLDKIEDQSYIKKQIILVDDKCEDETLKKIFTYKFKSEYKILKHKENKGKGSCIISAQKYVTGDLVIIQDGDLEYDPCDFKKLLNVFLIKKADAVYGSRIFNKKKFGSFISKKRVFANKILTLFSNLINKQELTDAHTCYKMFRSSIFKNIELKEKGFAFCPEITTKIANLNKKIYEVPINYKGRSFVEGKKIRFIDGIEAIFTIIKYAKPRYKKYF
jgi:glycosyltransferase involved in cell wall biosynthesis